MAEPTAIWPGSHDVFLTARKYKEAVAAAAKECAEDTKGQTCYICLESVHPHTKEGLVRGCACQGDQGFAHVSCLVRQDEILIEETNNKIIEKMKRQVKGIVRLENLTTDDANDLAEELNNLSLLCKLCKKQHNGVILRAIGWGCWKQCASKSERRLREDFPQVSGALTNLRICLYESGHTAEAKEVEQAIDTLKRAADTL